MLYLIIAIICSVLVSVLLKLLRQQQLDIRQTIVAGYPVAWGLTWLLLTPDVSALTTVSVAWWWIVLALGGLLPSVFIMLARSIEAVGIVATDAAQRLSLIIPIVAAFVLFGEQLSSQRVLGIGLGFLALLALLYRPAASSSQPQKPSPHPTDRRTMLWLLAVWLGYGVIDILFKQVAKQGAGFALSLFICFALAFVLLLVYLLCQRIRWDGKALGYGLLLGILNMGNIYAYIKAHQTLHESPSIVFTGMNVGVITLATLIGVWVFAERIHKVNVLGLGLAVACVLVLFLG